ncbi:hypothetical protein BDA96_03G242300 [Sorghum bicolor]|uniref:Uncharacterized protein n=2 Tax=Sorghum bicolor TaxID=4558 RepID=A0A921UQX4_SORBI|nr:uncharacterized protein LOC8054400 [Sorghum bicolor]EES01088.1 hypothetical protein SORBI_3003G224000 [Sorghum bicolor]KAG0538511.1 hypothetical protein BDA96_03G242300 [Sorghum bicolor]|eukprot:XP_002455968.1 uncharacterized protein LOC8054400 [Sorghum bicolor]
MSRKHHELEGAGGSGVGSDDAASGKAVWDTGSSLYDSYELAAVRRLLDRRLLAAAGGGVLALRDDGPPPAAGDTRSKGNKSRQVVPVSRVHHRKVTLRALFRAVANKATWAARPRRAPPLACAACAGMVHDQSCGAAVEPDLPPHGQL